MPSFSKNKDGPSCCNKRVNSACSVPRLSCSRLCPGTRYTTKVSDLPGVALVYLCVPDRQPQWHKQSRVVGACRVYMYTRFHCVHTHTAGSVIDWSRLPHHAPCIPTHVVSFTRVYCGQCGSGEHLLCLSECKALSLSLYRTTDARPDNTATWGTLCIYRHKVCTILFNFSPWTGQ